MRNRPVVIALATAGIIAGAHTGIAAIDNQGIGNTPEPVTQQTNPQSLAEAQVPVEVRTPADAQAPTKTPMETRTAASPANEPLQIAASGQPEQRTVRLPFTNIHLKVTQSTFPSSVTEFSELLPATVAYFDSKNANVALSGAPGSAFPSEASEFGEPLPAVVAYFDRVETQRVASLKSAPVASVAIASESLSTPAAD
jgi:hypothetical protein